LTPQDVQRAVPIEVVHQDAPEKAIYVSPHRSGYIREAPDIGSRVTGFCRDSQEL
jgi:hypothetical protein